VRVRSQNPKQKEKRPCGRDDVVIGPSSSNNASKLSIVIDMSLPAQPLYCLHVLYSHCPTGMSKVQDLSLRAFCRAFYLGRSCCYHEPELNSKLRRAVGGIEARGGQGSKRPSAFSFFQGFVRLELEGWGQITQW
jgi:hypothetical protein